jgi:hypothetical protein
MSVSSHVYAKWPLSATSAVDNFLANTIKVGLITATYTPAQATDQFWSTPQANEATGTGYTAGGATLASKTATTSGLVTTFTGAATSWASSTITARYAVLYDSTPGTATTDPLIAYVDFGANVSSTAGTFTITWDSTNGIFQVTVS